MVPGKELPNHFGRKSENDASGCKDTSWISQFLTKAVTFSQKEQNLKTSEYIYIKLRNCKYYYWKNLINSLEEEVVPIGVESENHTRAPT